MNQSTPLEKLSIESILTLLHQLDTLYYSNPLAEYEQAYCEVEQQVQQVFPGFTIAYAELSTIGSERFSHGGMRHVVVPQEEMDSEGENTLFLLQ